MKRVKKFISALLVAVIILTAAPLSGFVGLDIDFGWIGIDTKVSAADTELAPTGQCGENVYWTFDRDTGLLTISGTGATQNYSWGYSPFYDNGSIKSVVINNGVTSIGNVLFDCCTGLTSVTIPDSVTSIGSSAFSICNSLTSVTIPDSVTNIGSSAFSHCTSLTNIIIPDSVTNIGNSVFLGCTGLTSITIPDSVTVICDYAFSGCTGITNITIPGNITSIGSSVFSGCTGLTDITIPDSVKSIGDKAFYSCYSLKNVVIGNSVTRIGAYAFCDCSGITEITIPKSIEIIDDYAFECCTGLKSVNIPKSVTSIGWRVFKGCLGISSIDVDISNTVYDSRNNCNAIIEKTTNTLLFGCKNTVIPDTVEFLAEYSFENCSELTELTIPYSVKISVCFSKCTNIKKINITKGNGERIDYHTNFGQYYFYKDTPWYTSRENIEEIILEEGINYIGANFFRECSGLKTITIPSSVEKIGNDAFNRCENLETITFLGDGKIDFGTNVFAYCNKLKIVCKENSYIHNYAEANGLNYCIIDDSSNSFDLKNDILMGYYGSSKDLFISCASKIGFAAFEKNQSVETIELASNVERIFNKAFANCSNLSKVIIPQSVASIGDNAFEGCNKLTIWCYAGSYAEAYAIVHGIPVRYITLQLNENELELKENESVNLCASFNTDLNDVCEMIWTSDKPSVVSVTGDGKITAVGKGKAIVTATSSTGLSATCVVNVVSDEPQEKPKVNSVKIDDISLNYKKSKTVNPQIDADEGAKYTVTYSSSNNKVATVDQNGKVTATKKGSGSATITCTVTDEYGNTVTDTCAVKVSLSFGQILLVYVLFGWIWY